MSIVNKGTEKGLQRIFEFTHFRGSLIDKQIVVSYESYLLTPTGDKVDIEPKFYTVEGEEFDKWMAQLGTPVIIPAIVEKLKTL